jgi:uncharacterized membrane protein YraQ (UPF0718 family)
VACLAAAIFIGWALGRVRRELALRDYFWIAEDETETGQSRVLLQRAASLGGQLTRKLLPWLALATLAGIAIDMLIPTATVARIGTLSLALGVPLAVLLGGVIYADILLLIPIGAALISHGAAIPVVLTFMLAASGMSLPEILVLGRILQPRLVALFLVATLLVYMLLGFGFALI